MSGFFIELMITFNIIPLTLIVVRRLSEPSFK